MLSNNAAEAVKQEGRLAVFSCNPSVLQASMNCSKVINGGRSVNESFAELGVG